MKKAVFKPSFWEIYLMWVIIVLAITIVLGIGQLAGLAEPMAVVMLVVFVLVRSLIMALIFYLIPYFRIEVNDTHVIGPGSPWGPGWSRVRIPLTDFDEGNVRPTIPWFGFHRIASRESGTITVWWFDATELRRLLAETARAGPRGLDLPPQAEVERPRSGPRASGSSR